MTRKTITIFASLGAVVLLVVGYFGAQAWIKAHPATPSFDFSNLPESPRLTEFESSKIAKIENIAEGFTLERRNDQWALVSANVPVDRVIIEQGMISNKLWSMSSVWAEQVIEESPADLSVYGLDNPSGRVRISDSDGKSAEFIFGNFTPSRSSYYIQMADNPAVYTLSTYSSDSVRFTLDSIRNKAALFNFDPTAITRMILEKRPEEDSSGKGPIEISAKTGEDTWISQFSSYVLNSPYAGKYGVDSEKIGTIIESMQNIQLLAYVDDDPESLAVYGLDRPGRIYLENADMSLDILYGRDEAGVRFAKLANEPSVFTIQGLDAFIAAVPFEMLDKFALIYNIDNVEGFTVTADGRTLEATVQGKGEEAVFHLNGRRCADKEFRTFYQAVIGLLIDAEAAGQPNVRGEGTDFEVQYKLSTPAGVTAGIRLIPLNRDFYVLDRNGAKEFLIARTQVRKIFETADSMVYMN